MVRLVDISQGELDRVVWETFQREARKEGKEKGRGDNVMTWCEQLGADFGDVPDADT